MIAARHLSISGDVQGVGFRYSMCAEARRLQLAGWVRNRLDGSVEAVATGEPETLDRLEQWAQHGPAGAHVDALRTRAASAAETADVDIPFGQRPTV